MKKFYFNYVILLMAVFLCATSCSKDDEKTQTYNYYYIYREANIPTVSTVEKNGQSYRPVHFFVLEIDRKGYLHRYEVYNDDAVKYYGLTGLSTIPGYPGWNYNTQAVKTIEMKFEKGKFTLDDGTVLNWVVSDDNYITALKDNNGSVQYVAWKDDEKF